MKWIILTSLIVVTASCAQNTEVIEYKQVGVVPKRSTPVLTQYVTPMVQPVTVDYIEPLDVTTTSIDFY